MGFKFDEGMILDELCEGCRVLRVSRLETSKKWSHVQQGSHACQWHVHRKEWKGTSEK